MAGGGDVAWLGVETVNPPVKLRGRRKSAFVQWIREPLPGHGRPSALQRLEIQCVVRCEIVSESVVAPCGVCGEARGSARLCVSGEMGLCAPEEAGVDARFTPVSCCNVARHGPVPRLPRPGRLGQRQRPCGRLRASLSLHCGEGAGTLSPPQAGQLSPPLTCHHSRISSPARSQQLEASEASRRVHALHDNHPGGETTCSPLPKGAVFPGPFSVSPMAETGKESQAKTGDIEAGAAAEEERKEQRGDELKPCGDRLENWRRDWKLGSGRRMGVTTTC